MKTIKKLVEQEIAEQEKMSPVETRDEFVRGRLHGLHRVLYLIQQEEKIYLTDYKFEDFWKKYPRHIAKKNALKAWTKLKVDDELFVKIMLALEKALGQPQWKDKQYIPHPATWLNGERWNDEVESVGGVIKDKYKGL